MKGCVLSGFEIGLMVDHERQRIGRRKKHEVTSQSKIIFDNDEHILRVELDYDDRAILGIRISTTAQLISLGPHHNSEFFTDYSVPDNSTAIIGFQIIYSSDRIVEISLFEAPLKKKLQRDLKHSSTHFLTRLSTNHNPKFSKNSKYNQDELKSTFKLYKRLKKNQSF